MGQPNTPHESHASHHPHTPHNHHHHVTSLCNTFPKDVIDAAQATTKKWGVPASVTLAQWALESACGSKLPVGSNNPFGIKVRKGQKGVMTTTHEDKKGKHVKTTAEFRQYTSLKEAFDDHGRLLATGTGFTKARLVNDKPEKYAEALTHTYATDPHYGSKLKSIMKKNNLTQYDAIELKAGEAEAAQVKDGPTEIKTPITLP
jgi:flagellum-specific peptidoglycan hydrolase FlgJ